jgi:hypothetical protein
VAASAAELRAEITALKSDVEKEMKEMNQRSLRMEAQLQELVARGSSS